MSRLAFPPFRGRGRKIVRTNLRSPLGRLISTHPVQSYGKRFRGFTVRCNANGLLQSHHPFRSSKPRHIESCAGLLAPNALGLPIAPVRIRNSLCARKKTWRIHGVRAEMRRSFPRRLYRRRALIETLFSSVKRKLSARAPGRTLPMQKRQAPMLGLSFNLYRLRHRYLFLEDVNRARWLLVFRIAMENNKVERNPIRLVKPRPVSNTRVRREETRLRATIEVNCKEHMPELDLVLHTGLRRSEMYGLTWENVNLARCVLTIPRSKNGEMRHVPLNTAARSALAESQRRGDGTGNVIRNKERRPLVGPRHWFEPAILKAKIPSFSWHCLRHTLASRLVMAGVDLRAVQELMGHKQICMTVRYAHLSPDHALAAVQRLAQAKTPVTPPTAAQQRTPTGTTPTPTQSCPLLPMQPASGNLLYNKAIRDLLGRGPTGRTLHC
jgi:integrase